MTNSEKYLKDEETGNFVQAFSCWYYGITRELENADKMLVEFLKAEATPILTEDEKVILRNIAKHSDFEKIGRDKIGGLYVTCRINIPTEEKWTISFYNHLFQFIKERRRISNKRIIRR